MNSNFKKLKIKIFKIRKDYFGHFIFWVIFLWQKLKKVIWENYLFLLSKKYYFFIYFPHLLTIYFYLKYNIHIRN